MTSALLLVDVQRNMLEGSAPVPAAAAVRTVLSSLLASAREQDALVIHIQNDGPPGSPDERETDGWQLVFEARPDELVVGKRVPDAFAATMLDATLRDRGVDSVIIAGMQSEFCIAETARAGRRAGFEVTLVSDGHATYDGDGVSATTTSAKVAAELANAGVALAPASAVRFS